MKEIFGRSRSRVALFKTKPTDRFIRRAKKGSPGQVLVLVSLGMVVLLGFAALAIDVGQLWSVRRHMQTAADAAALAAAVAVRQGSTPTAPADSVATQNGFTDGSNNVTVTVNNPPANGPYAGNSAYVEVIVSQPQPSFFLNALGYSSTSVSARSVASSVNGPACLYALDPSAAKAVDVAGSSTTTLSCGAIVDSNNSDALNSGGGGVLTASNIGVDGGYLGSGFTPTPVTGIAPAPDPLAYLQAPTVGACNYTGWRNNSGNPGCSKVICYANPGVYCGGIQIASNIPVVFNPGVYILEGGMKVTASTANISGSGVMFYNTATGSYPYGEIALSGSNAANLSAPTSGPYAGILFFQDRSVPSSAKGSTITGSSGSTFDGAIYFSTTAVSYSGNSSSGGYTIIVADTVSITGTSVLSDNYSSLSGGSPIKATALYE